MANQNSDYYSQLYAKSGGNFYENTTEESDFFSVSDTFMGTINGAEEALRSTFGLVNYINPFSDSFLEEDVVQLNVIDEPETTIGQLAGGFAQFAVGAALVTGAITGGLAAISAFTAIGAASLANMGIGAGIVSGASKVLKATLSAQKWYRTAELGKGVGAISGRKAFEFMVQAPMVDFAAFHADSGRFVDLVEGIPGLGETLHDALGSDSDDPALWARVKNVLDGAMIGGVTEAFFAGFKKMGKAMGREMDAKGLETDPEAIEKAAREDAFFRQVEIEEMRDTNFQLDDADIETLDAMTFAADNAELRPEIAEQLDQWIDGYGKDGDFMSFMRLYDNKNPEAAVGELLDLGPFSREYRGRVLHQDGTQFTHAERLAEIFKGEGVTWEDLGAWNAPHHLAEEQGNLLAWTLYGSLDDKAREVLERGRKKQRARKRAEATGEEVAEEAVEELDMSAVTEGPTKELADKMKSGEISETQVQAELLRDIEALDISVTALGGIEHLSRLKDDPVAIARLALHANKSVTWANKVQAEVLKLLQSMDGITDVAQKQAIRQEIFRAQQVNFQLIESANTIFSNTGWGLERAKREMLPDKEIHNKFLEKYTKKGNINGDTFMDTYRSRMARAETDPKALKELDLMDKHLRESILGGQTPAERMEMIAKWTARPNHKDLLHHLVNVRTQNIIAGGKTIAIAAWSPVFIEPYKVIRNVLGEVWRQTNPGQWQIDSDRLIKVAQKEVYTTTRSSYYAVQNAKAYLAAIKRSMTGDKGDLGKWHEMMRQQANTLRTSDRFSLDVQTMTKAQVESFRQSDELALRMLGGALKWQDNLSSSAKLIQAIDYSVQNAVGRARIEANMMFKALMEPGGIDIKTAKRTATRQADLIFNKTEAVMRKYTADEVWKRTVKDPEVVSGKVNINQRLLENIQTARNEVGDIRAMREDGRMRAQGAVLNRDVHEMSRSTEDRLKHGGDYLNEDEVVPQGQALDGYDLDQVNRVNKRLQDPGAADMIGSDAVRRFVGVGADTAQIIRKNNLLRLWAPFLQVPINSAAVGLDAIVGGYMSNMAEALQISGPRATLFPGTDAFVKSLQSADPAVRMNTAVDGYIAATVVGTLGTLIAQEGVGIPTENDPLPFITGGGPSDAATAEALRSAGWQPYSIKVGSKYISYSRMEPFATWLGTIVDSIQLAHYYDATNAHKPTHGTFDTVLVTSMSLLARQLTDKTFTRGLADMADMLSGDSEALKRWASEAGRSFVIPNSVRDVGNYLHGDMADLKETRNLIDKVYATIPGLSSELKDKKRNILGEPMQRTFIGGNPFTDMMIPANARLVNDGVIEKELASIPNLWRKTPMKFKGVDTLAEEFRLDGRSLYDRWQDNMTTHKIRGKTLRQSLRVLIADPDYQAVDPNMDPDGNPSPRAGMIETVIRKYQTAAFNDLAKREPDLRRAIRNAKDRARVRRSARAGDGATIIDLLD